jgi:hypothetical protein
MRYEMLKKGLIRKVIPSRARFYVESRGWQRVEGIRESTAVYRHPALENEELMIPDQSFADYTLRIYDVLVKLAEIESRDPRDVLSDLLLESPADIVEVKIVERVTEDGTIPLESGIRLVKGTRDLLKASAHAVIAAPGVPDDRAAALTDDFLQGCRMAPPERGSYVVRFVCPSGVLPSTQTDLISMEPGLSLTRKVTTTLMEEVGSLVNAVQSGKGEVPLSLPKRERTIRRDFCGALGELEPRDEDAVVNLDVAWAGEKPPKMKSPQVIHISKKHFVGIRRIGVRLAEEPAEVPLKIKGRIFDLEDRFDFSAPEEIKRIEVRFWFMEKDRQFKAKMTLPLEERERAFHAFENMLDISVEGRLVRGEKISTIEEARNFRIVGSSR